MRKGHQRNGPSREEGLVGIGARLTGGMTCHRPARMGTCKKVPLDAPQWQKPLACRYTSKNRDVQDRVHSELNQHWGNGVLWP